MPAAPRKSTGTARNSKKHIPYRHDDLQHGKRTGMAVDVVDRNSDDFEPFDKLLSQADTRTPPRVKGKRKSLVPSPVYEDEDGEMSMDIASPLSYFNSQRARVPESFINTGPPARSFYMSPEADFDEVPSPRVSVAAISASRRRSSVKFTARASRLGGSPGLPPGDSDEDLEDGFEPPPTFEHRSRYTPLSPSPDRASFPRKSKGHDKPLFLPDPDSEDEQPEPSTSKRTNRRKSSKASVALVGLEQDGEEEEVEEDHPEDVEMDLDPPDEEDFNSRRSRKLSSIVEAEEEEEDEPEPMDFEQDAGPEELPEDQPDEPPEEPDDPPPAKPPKKRGNKKISFDENSVGVKRPSKKPRSNRTPLADRTSDSRYVSIRPVSASPENPQGLRRGRRYRYKPLDWWRLEKVVYGANHDEDSQDNGDEDEEGKPVHLVAPIKAILRLPQDPVEPLGKKHKKRRGRSVTVDPESGQFPEAGWDKDTEAFGHVVDFVTQEEVRRRLAFTTRMSREVPAKKADYTYQKIFSYGANVAAGHIQLEPGAEKPNKSSKDNSYIFHVIQGAVHVKVHTTSFMICQGGCFLVPRGNYYFIKNVCDRAVKIFFAQYREPSDEEEEGAEGQTSGRVSRRIETSEQSMPPVVRRGKTASQKPKGKDKATLKVGPPKGKKK